MPTTICTHDEAIRVLRNALPGVTDLHVFAYQHSGSGRRSLDVPPRPAVRGWSCTIPRIGRAAAVATGSWKLPTTAEQIREDAQREVERAIRVRGREMLYERDFAEELDRDAEDHAA